MPLTTRGLDETIASHERLVQRHRDLRPLTSELAGEVRDMIASSWATQTSPGGEPWPPRQRRSESTGDLEGAADVVPTEDGFTIRVERPHASFVFFGTRHQPARNPLPVEPQGGRLVWMMRGAAGEWWTRALERVQAHLTGTDRSERR